MKRFFGALWRMLKSNWILKIMAVLFAVILWSYVLAETDPLRTREVEDITVRYSNAGELEDKGLAISGSLSDILETVTVKVEVKQSEIKYLNNKNISAYVDLSTISGTGESTLDITASSTYGEVLSITPAQVTLNIDKLVTNTVPVKVETSGSVAEGYYALEPELSQEVINITGAKVDVDKVVRSVCYINLAGLSEGYSESVEVVLLDKDGNIVDQNLFTGNIPSVIVKLDVLAKKTVPIDTSAILLGEDELADGYEISEITVEPETIDIIGEKSVLDEIDAIGLVPISVSGESADKVALMDYDLPEGVSLITEGQAQVYISIKEITEVKTFSNITIQAKNLPEGMSVTFDTQSIDVSVLAGVNKLAQLFKEDIIPYVDLDGLIAGEYTLTIMFELPEGFSTENVSSVTKQITVTLTD